MFHPIEWLRCLRTRLNRPALHGFDARSFWSLFECDGVPFAGPPGSLTTCERPPELLVVVTTYRRAQACEQLLEMLRAALDHTPLRSHVLVFNDASDADYAACRALAHALFPAQLTWLDARVRLGKPGFWQVYQTAFLAAQLLTPEHALFIQDDIEIPADLLRRVYAFWRRTEDDPLRRVLYLFSSHDDEPS
ncbi:MAG TPA: hypothetical protein VFZ61_33600, partial [Polyangiales bacterium]